MKLYRVSLERAGFDEVVFWASTAANARAARQEIMSEHNVKRKDVGIEEIDVPTKKNELLIWLNDKKV